MSTAVPNFPVPSFADLVAETTSDFTGLPGADVTLRAGVVPVLALILAKLTAGEYIYLANFPNRCLIPTLMVAPYLDVYCEAVGLVRNAGAAAAGTVAFTGTNGIAFPAGTQMQDSTGTITIATTANGTWTGNTVSAPAKVVSISTNAAGVAAASGTAGNLAANAPLTLLVGIAGVSANGVVSGAGFSGGTAQESDEQLQQQLQARLSMPPQGGANNDFVSWAKLVAGVTRVWVYPSQYGGGTCAILFMTDSRANPVPLAGDVANVQASIVANAPVYGTPTTLAPVALNQAVVINGLLAQPGYTLAQAKANAAAAIAALNYTTTPGGYGWDGQAQNYLTGGTLYVEQVSAAINNAPGVANFDLTTPSADVTAGFGDIVQLSPPTFT